MRICTARRKMNSLRVQEFLADQRGAEGFLGPVVNRLFGGPVSTDGVNHWRCDHAIIVLEVLEVLSSFCPFFFSPPGPADGREQ